MRTRDASSQLNIKVWGPSAWRWLHVVAWTMYPETPTYADRAQMIDFLRCFARSIPCPKCRSHFSRMLKRDLVHGAESPILESRQSLTAATVGWHNRVNRRLNKKEMDYATVEKMYTTPPQATQRSYLGLWLVLASSVAVLYWYNRRSRQRVQTVHRAPVWQAVRRKSSYGIP